MVLARAPAARLPQKYAGPATSASASLLVVPRLAERRYNRRWDFPVFKPNCGARISSLDSSSNQATIYPISQASSLLFSLAQAYKDAGAARSASDSAPLHACSKPVNPKQKLAWDCRWGPLRAGLHSRWSWVTPRRRRAQLGCWRLRLRLTGLETAAGSPYVSGLSLSAAGDGGSGGEKR